MKLLLRRGVAGLLHASGAPLKRLRGKVCILAYHRVLKDGQLRPRALQPGMYVLEESFDRQMRFLSKHCDVISFPDLLGLWGERRWDGNGRYCVITFDDGWVDNYLNALPILADHRLPATVFLTTSLIGTNRWFWPQRLGRLREHCLAQGVKTQSGGGRESIEDRVLSEMSILLNYQGAGDAEMLDRAVESLKDCPERVIEQVLGELEERAGMAGTDERALLNWDEVREMSEKGMSFGSHGSSHRIFTRLTVQEMENELVESWESLQSPGVAAVPVLAYPNGDWNQKVEDMAAEAGYRAAVTTRFGLEGSAPKDLFALRRVCIHDDITSTVPTFAMRISGLLCKQTAEP
ncbi:MAG TPA: polysaccharide deacetylase family protein [bacterium]